MVYGGLRTDSRKGNSPGHDRPYFHRAVTANAKLHGLIHQIFKIQVDNS